MNMQTANYKLQITNYLAAWWTIMARPIYFYTVLREESWKEKSLTFALISSWIIAILIAIFVFVSQYIPIGATLVEGITGYKFIIVFPVLLTLAAVFFFLTAFILGGILVVGFCLAFYSLAVGFHYICIALGGKGKLERMLQFSFYSSAVIMAAVFPIALAALTRGGLLDPASFAAGFNFIFVLTVVYAYGIWAVAVRKAYGLPKWKAFAAAIIPAVVILIFIFIFDKIVLTKLQSWITPL